MSFAREGARAAFHRWREAGAAAIVAAIGLRMIWQGGYFFIPLGLAVLALACCWLTLALRRMLFDPSGAAPGLVEVDEGQIGYMGPTFGGFIAVRELVEIRLVELYGRRHWRLKQADGQALLVPADARGAERLFDAFAALPAFDTAALSEAMRAPARLQVVWRRSAAVEAPNARP